MNARSGKYLENRVAELIRGTGLYDSVQRSVAIELANGVRRRVDVVATVRGALHTFTVLFECKAWSRKVDMDRFASFSTTVKESGAAAGVLVAESGFSDGVRRWADTYLNLALYSVEEIEDFCRSVTLDPPDVSQPTGDPPADESTEERLRGRMTEQRTRTLSVFTFVTGGVGPDVLRIIRQGRPRTRVPTHEVPLPESPPTLLAAGLGWGGGAPFTVQNKRGQTFYLHEKIVTIRGGNRCRIYYFARAAGGGAISSVPSGYHVTMVGGSDLPGLVRLQP